MSVSTSGFAVRRNGSCMTGEVFCGRTLAPYVACCPTGSFCPNQYNVECCPSETNCTDSLVASPRCANSAWFLYNYNGYFCCDQGLIAYGTTSNSDGCGLPGTVFSDGEQILAPIVPKLGKFTSRPLIDYGGGVCRGKDVG